MPGAGKAVVGLGAGAPEVDGVGEMPSPDDARSALSSGVEDPQPPITAEVTNEHRTSERKLHPFDRIIITFSLVRARIPSERRNATVIGRETSTTVPRP